MSEELKHSLFKLQSKWTAYHSKQDRIKTSPGKKQTRSLLGKDTRYKLSKFYTQKHAHTKKEKPFFKLVHILSKITNIQNNTASINGEIQLEYFLF